MAGQGGTDIEELLRWTWQDQRADDEYAKGGGGPRAGLDSVLVVARRGELGTHVDGGGRLDVGELHPDAEAVYEAVMSLPGRVALLLRRHALAGTRPETYPGARVVLVPEEDEDGHPVIVADRRRRPYLCRLRQAVVWGRRGELGMTVRDLVEARADYSTWWGGLVDLAHHFTDGPAGGALVRRVEPLPAAPAAPWSVKVGA